MRSHLGLSQDRADFHRDLKHQDFHERFRQAGRLKLVFGKAHGNYEKDLSVKWFEGKFSPIAHLLAKLIPPYC